MSRKNRQGAQIRHTNLLIKSTTDDVCLCQAVETRFKDFCEAHLRIRGVQLNIPQSLDQDMLRWRTLAVRYRQGDFRHSEAELCSLHAVAQWTVDANCALRNQPSRVIDWRSQ